MQGRTYPEGRRSSAQRDDAATAASEHGRHLFRSSAFEEHVRVRSALHGIAMLFLAFNPSPGWQMHGRLHLHDLGRQRVQAAPISQGELVIDQVKLTEGDTSPTALADEICLLPGEPEVRIEVAPSNSRRIFSGIDIIAPIDMTWQTLTDYEHLQDVVPSLVSNTVVSRTEEGGARLDQIGAAKVLPGIKFKARAVLDVVPYDEQNPIPQNMLMEALPWDSPDQQDREYFRNVSLQRDVFPHPYAYTNRPYRDITMQNVVGEGDFLHYQGVWRMQELPLCIAEGQSATRLTYAVEIRPKGLLPVCLIENRIASDLKTNLLAIKKHVESLPLGTAV